MAKAVGVLFAMVDENYRRLKSIVAGLSQEQLDYNGPSGKENSTSQLLRHLAYVDLKWVFRIKGKQLSAELEDKYGPALDKNNELPNTRGVRLDTILKEYEDVVGMLKSVCLELTEDRLDDEVDYEDGKRATIRWGIWHIADHSRYHQAHINQLLKWYEQTQS